MLFSTCKSCITKILLLNSTTPGHEFIIFFRLWDHRFHVIHTTNFLELKCIFYQPVLDYKHLIHELQALLHKEQAEYIFTGVINNLRCPCKKLRHSAYPLIFSAECIFISKQCYLILCYHSKEDLIFFTSQFLCVSGHVIIQYYTYSKSVIMFKTYCPYLISLPIYCQERLSNLTMVTSQLTLNIWDNSPNILSVYISYMFMH